MSLGWAWKNNTFVSTQNLSLSTPDVTKKSKRLPTTHSIPKKRKNVPALSEHPKRVALLPPMPPPKKRPLSLLACKKLAKRVGEKKGVDHLLLLAMIRNESHFKVQAKSEKGAIGLMQLMPDTAKELGVKDPFDPWQNLMGGAEYIRRLLVKFDGNVRFALAGYNAGPGNVLRYNGIPPFRETQEYVAKVMKTWEKLKRQHA